MISISVIVLTPVLILCSKGSLPNPVIVSVYASLALIEITPVALVASILSLLPLNYQQLGEYLRHGETKVHASQDATMALDLERK